MSMSDDPRGFRRGQPGNRDYEAPQPRGGRPAQPQRDDRYDNQRQPEPPQARAERERPQDKPQQAAFSAYRPEAYAAPERRPPARQERPEWEDNSRSAPPPAPSRNMAPTADPFPRTPPQQQSRDPYSSAPNDPYAPASSQRGYENDWRQQDPYQDQGANAFPSYYPPHDEPQSGGDVQSVHNRFFAPEPEPIHAPPPAQNRFRGSFDDHDHDHHDADFGPDSRSSGYEPAQRHHGTQAFDSGFDDKLESEWDQAPPPASVRPFHPPATVPDDDLDADFFADEDDYDGEDYPAERGGGRKRLMAAVLVGAVVTGGGLAFLYKSGGNGGDQLDGPSLIAADERPIKAEPSEPGGRDFPNKGKLIYERLAGPNESDAGGGSAKLAGASAASGQLPGVVTTGGTLEERIENALKAQKEEDTPAASGKPASADAPRTVRTVTFGPDGSQQAVRPSTQRVASNKNLPDGLSNGIVVTSESTAASGRDVAPDEEEVKQPARQQPKPALRTATIPQAAPPSISEAAGGSGNFFVQIAARNDQDAAMTAFASLQQKYAGVLGNHSPSVRKVDLGDKGVWYRLLVGPMDSKTDADALCEQLKTAGMKGCFARKD